MIKNALPDKSGNPEILKKRFETFSPNVPIVGEDLLRVCFYSLVIQVISDKTLCNKGLTSNLKDIFT